MNHPQANAEESSRFEVQHRLDGGGFGSVFVVFDRLRGQRVALKRLERLDPGSIYRFKQEFRALADVKHPNLVKLYELFVEDSGWSFTMELVEGVPFDEWCWGALPKPLLADSLDSTQPELPNRKRANTEPISATAPKTSPRQDTEPAVTSVNGERLRDAIRQLALGVSALHAEGILHRDLKPSNVLVDASGRVVILDFGLVATGVIDSHVSVDGATAGTPAYMSPEQAGGAPLSAASDWYAVGLMIYEALTGRLPFVGTPAQIMAAKMRHEASDPRETDPGLHDDLVELALGLLARDPGARLSGTEVLSRLDIELSWQRDRREQRGGEFMGRETERAELERAFEAAKRGNTVVAHVHGPSGYGKSTLIRHFLDELSGRSGAVVLAGRCYERESVPFKALDELIDSLYHYLRRLTPVEAATFTPRNAQALVRLFPTLGRLEAMAVHGAKAPEDPHELRRKAFKALREMFARLTDTRPVVLAVDDAQWGDSDSAALFRDLLAPPDVPPLLLIVAYRGDGSEDNELVRTLRVPKAADSAWHTVDISLGPLNAVDARLLARNLLGPASNSKELAEAICRESGGSPLFIAELARRAGAGAEGGVSVQRLVAERVASLPEPTRAVLELMASSERPLQQAELIEASSQGLEATMTSLDGLREAHLVNVVLDADGVASFEILHDKMRASVRDGLSRARLSECHRRLALTLSGSDRADPETLAYHFAQAGDTESALRWTEIAADRAMEGVAFDHVVELRRRALELASAEARGERCEKLAAALARAGRGEESARAYLEVAAAVTGEAQRNMQQAAAEQYLRAGHVEEALEAFGPLLAEAGLALPATPARAVVSLLWHRSRLKWRGFDFEEREPAELDPAHLRAIDFCWSVGTGLAGIDLVRSARYYVMSLEMSLKHGDPYRIARSLSIEAIMKALESTAGVSIATELADRAHEIARRVGNPHALGWATAARAVVAWGNTDLPNCRRLADEAISHLRQRSLETFREIGSMQVWFALNSTFLMGDLKTLAERAPACAREAQARGDRYTHSTVRAYILPYLWVSRDQVDQARHEAEGALAVWKEGAWYHQHWAWLRAMCFLDLYEGKGTLVWRRTQKHKPSMQRSMQLRVRTLRSELQYLEARGALEMLVMGDRDRAHERLVLDRIQRLVSEDNALASAYAQALRAGLAVHTRSIEAAAEEFELARSTFDELTMPLHAAAAEMRHAECLSGMEPGGGEQLYSAALERLRGHGVENPVRFGQMLVPRIAPERTASIAP